MNDIINNIEKLNKKISKFSILESLIFISNQKFNKKKVFSTSFSVEDQIIIYNLNKIKNNNILVFTLDTGRLFDETYQVFDKTQKKYKNIKINIFFPSENDLNKYIIQNGINGFYHSIEKRKECCKIRKVIPLNRALENVDLWITGIRSEQSNNRKNKQILEFDKSRNLIKFNPILNWKLEEVEEYIHKHSIPFNPLHNKGFKSIGCKPCTRSIKEGEEFRSGRWWWENINKKECGLHN